MDNTTIIEPVIKKDPFEGTTTMVMGIQASPAIEILISQHFKAPYIDGGREQALDIIPYTITDKYGRSKGALNISSTLFRDDATMSVLFEDESVLTKELIPRKDGTFDWEPTDQDCSCFLFKRIKMIRVYSHDNAYDFSFEDYDILYQGLPELFQLLIEKFLEAAAKESGWAPTASKPETISDEASSSSTSFDQEADYCYVYLMNDSANGYYKIGMSNNPEYRESTLQSEKPTIVKVCHKKYPSRRIASAMEATLHKIYEAKRIRGEWFSLKEKDVWEIKQILS